MTPVAASNGSDHINAISTDRKHTQRSVADLIDLSHVQDAGEKQLLRELFQRYDHVFAKHSADYGMTDIIEYTTDVGDHTRIKHVPRR